LYDSLYSICVSVILTLVMHEMYFGSNGKIMLTLHTLLEKFKNYLSTNYLYIMRPLSKTVSVLLTLEISKVGLHLYE